MIVLAMLVLNISNLNAQSKKIYDEMADAEKQIADAVKKAKAENKHVFVKLGGNWCKWCVLFHNYTHANKDIMNVLDANYVEVLVSTSKAKKNHEIMRKYKNPSRFGYPVFMIIDGEGNLIHTQNSVVFEKTGEFGYDSKKIIKFLNNWTPGALIYKPKK